MLHPILGIPIAYVGKLPFIGKLCTHRDLSNSWYRLKDLLIVGKIPILPITLLFILTVYVHCSNMNFLKDAKVTQLCNLN